MYNWSYWAKMSGFTFGEAFNVLSLYDILMIKEKCLWVSGTE